MGGGGQPKPSRDTYNEYIKKHKLSEEEPRECPICILEFDKDDIVKGLKCSKMHIYHKECLTDLI